MYQQNVSLQGRGILIYVHETFKDTIEIPSVTDFSEHKLLSVKVGNNADLLVAAIYRSDSGTKQNNENLLNLIREINTMKHSHKLIIGDFNYKHIDWETCYTPKNENSDEQLFINCIQDVYWNQHITKPTRYREGEEPSTLDLVFTNEEAMIQQVSHQSPLGKSDHSVLLINFQIKHTPNFTPRTIHCYDKGDYESMRNDLNINWDAELDSCAVNEQWSKIKEKIRVSVTNHVPSYQTTEEGLWKKGKIPLSKATRKEIRKKHRCWQRAYETKQRTKISKWKQQRNKVNKLLKAAEEKFEVDLANEAKLNPKKIWKYVKSQSKVKTSISPLKNSRTAKLTNNEKEQAEVLAAQFASVMVDEPEGDIPRIPNKPLITPPLDTINVTTEMVLKKLKDLNVTKSPGPDEIHPRILKEAAPSLAPALATLYNNTLKSHEVPDEWRTALITAIFKKGDKSDPSNYRPISLTCIICKVLESIIYDHIVQHMVKNKLFSKSQYGFISKRAAALQLLNVLEIWCNILDEDGIIDDINMDFQKAFDTVPHRRLLGKLESYGIQGDTLGWIQAFLTGRKQRVTINGHSSEWTDVKSGVPQGSVIAALLFVIYINDLPENIKSHLYLFADDCKFFRQIISSEDTSIMQKDLDMLLEWSNTWLLKFHPGKCVTLRLSRHKLDEKHTYHLGENELENVEEVKDLGIIVDNNLKFQKHISSKVNKANQSWGTIKRTFKHMNPYIFKKLFCAQVRSHLEYAVQFWSPYLRKDINKIESVQRRATKYIPGFNNLSYQTRLRKLDLPTLAYRRLRGSMIEVFKIFHSYDEDVSQKLTTRDTTTRGHSYKLFPATSKKIHPRHHSFHQRVTKPWNSLPAAVVDSPNLNTFKNRLDKHWSGLPLKFDHLARDFDPCC